MTFATTSDGIKLYYESAGTGSAIVFVHEFGGNHWSWEPQMNFFPRRHRCVTYAARGFPPSDIPPDVASYSQARAVEDEHVLREGSDCHIDVHAREFLHRGRGA